jgi:hypothetical protein
MSWLGVSDRDGLRCAQPILRAEIIARGDDRSRGATTHYVRCELEAAPGGRGGAVVPPDAKFDALARPAPVGLSTALSPSCHRR